MGRYALGYIASMSYSHMHIEPGNFPEASVKANLLNAAAAYVELSQIHFSEKTLISINNLHVTSPEALNFILALHGEAFCRHALSSRHLLLLITGNLKPGNARPDQ